jgi:hypothetical protein
MSVMEGDAAQFQAAQRRPMLFVECKTINADNFKLRGLDQCN